MGNGRFGSFKPKTPSLACNALSMFGCVLNWKPSFRPVATATRINASSWAPSIASIIVPCSSMLSRAAILFQGARDFLLDLKRHALHGHGGDPARHRGRGGSRALFRLHLLALRPETLKKLVFASPWCRAPSLCSAQQGGRHLIRGLRVLGLLIPKSPPPDDPPYPPPAAAAVRVEAVVKPVVLAAASLESAANPDPAHPAAHPAPPPGRPLLRSVLNLSISIAFRFITSLVCR